MRTRQWDPNPNLPPYSLDLPPAQTQSGAMPPPPHCHLELHRSGAR